MTTQNTAKLQQRDSVTGSGASCDLPPSAVIWSPNMDTPGRRQYLEIKKKYAGEILLFRMGDFYETFDQDAKKVSDDLGITLTSREMGKGNRIPLAGIPYHSLDSYLSKLIAAGHRVAICEQVGDVAASKGEVVKREVVRVVTPGTVVEDSILDQGVNNYLICVVIQEDMAGLAYIDITTEEFATTQLPISDLAFEIARLHPSEILITEQHRIVLPILSDTTITTLSEKRFNYAQTKNSLKNHFRVASLKALGCNHLPLASIAAGTILEYLARHHNSSLSYAKSLHIYSTDSHMVLDAQTIRNLELFEGARWNTSSFSLFSILDETKTVMGRRLLRRWIGQPLLDIKTLLHRQDGVAWFHANDLKRQEIATLLSSVSDLERLTTKLKSDSASPRDLIRLSESLDAVPKILGLINQDEDIGKILEVTKLFPCNRKASQLITRAIRTDATSSTGDGKTINRGFSTDLDTFRDSATQAQNFLVNLEKTERQRTGIKSLKIGFNKVFGYYIEVTRPNLSLIPEDYVRRQTLVGAERFVTSEIQAYESIIRRSKENISEIESQIFRKLCRQLEAHSASILLAAKGLAYVDVLGAFASVAIRNNYIRPTLSQQPVLRINQGRHPVVEQMLDPGTFVHNDTELRNNAEQIILLTGPNMSGKSTYIRQVAVITLMAQIGSFVPAASATIGIVDRIFTRIGLQDDLAAGHSTFMIEMIETASILNQATANSLIILDEIGRGTSTYDGLAIAKSVVEFIHNNARLGCKTLFATHYHELTQLTEYLHRIRNFQVTVSESDGEFIFLHRILKGGADKSYGVHVAQLAGLPDTVINRAWEILNSLEAGNQFLQDPEKAKSHRPYGTLPLEQQTRPSNAGSKAIEILLSLDISNITPLEAITKLDQLQTMAQDAAPQY